MVEPDLTGLSDAEIVRRALYPEKILAKMYVVDELARRAIENPSLLEAAAEAISLDKTVTMHWSPPLGWLGASRILTSGKPTAIAHLLKEMDTWSSDEQADLMRLVAGPGKLVDLTKEFQGKYGWLPKYRY
jgi:hypothetical protein